MRVLAIDPGPTRSAWCVYEDGCVLGFGKGPNEWLMENDVKPKANEMAIEMIASYGMPVGAEVFETCVWIGRFVEAWAAQGGTANRVFRKDVKLHLCNSPRANDATTRQALIDRFGGKQKAIGNKAQPGPLYGISGDVWQALAVAVTYADTRKASNTNAPVRAEEEVA